MKTTDKKQEILDAAMELIRTTGVEKTTMREIAAAAGVTTGAVYHHYRNKAELFEDIINESIHFSQKILATVTSGEKTDPEEIFDDIADNVRKRLRKDDEQKLHIALLGDIISKDDENRDRVVENYRQTIKNAGDLFAPASGIENEKYKYLMASYFVAALDGMAIQRALGVFPEDDETVIETFIAFFKDAILGYLEENKE